MKLSRTQTHRTALLVGGLIVVVGLIVGIVVYMDSVAPAQTVVLTVDDTSITMGYFLKRARMSGGEPLDVLQALAREQVVRIIAAEPPFSIEISSDELNAYLRQVARGSAETISDDEYREWLRQQLNETQLNEGEYRELLRTNLMTARLSQAVIGEVDDRAEQVHLYAIPLNDPESAFDALERLRSGESFRSLAAELSVDPDLAARGGDLGWFARGFLPPDLEAVAFDRLSVDEVSAPVDLGEQTLVLKLVGREARRLDPATAQLLQRMEFETWLSRIIPEHDITFHGFENGYDGETDAWVKARLREMAR